MQNTKSDYLESPFLSLLAVSSWQITRGMTLITQSMQMTTPTGNCTADTPLDFEESVLCIPLACVTNKGLSLSTNTSSPMQWCICNCYITQVVLRTWFASLLPLACLHSIAPPYSIILSLWSWHGTKILATIFESNWIDRWTHCLLANKSTTTM